MSLQCQVHPLFPQFSELRSNSANADEQEWKTWMLDLQFGAFCQLTKSLQKFDHAISSLAGTS